MPRLRALSGYAARLQQTYSCRLRRQLYVPRLSYGSEDAVQYLHSVRRFVLTMYTKLHSMRTAYRAKSALVWLGAPDVTNILRAQSGAAPVSHCAETARPRPPPAAAGAKEACRVEERTDSGAKTARSAGKIAV